MFREKLSAGIAGNLWTCRLATDPSTRAATMSLVSRLTHPTLRFEEGAETCLTIIEHAGKPGATTFSSWPGWKATLDPPTSSSRNT
jgi:hypothetical protein